MDKFSWGRRRLRLLTGPAVAVALGITGLGAVANGPANAAPVPGPASAAPEPALLGTSQDNAAGSCWEIKQARPSAPSGAYWLLTPKMAEPQQFYCDQTTDGGGWVLVGKGRNGWTMDDSGKGSAAALLDTGYQSGHDTHQYTADLVDQLLNGGRVVDLSEGIRVRRARNTTGTDWQEARFRPDTRQTGWSWAFPARFSVQSWSFTPGSSGSGTSSGFSGTTDYFGTGSSWARIRTGPSEQTGYTSGFAYGDSVTGSNAASSYLWAPSNGAGRAVPVAQVYVRPRVLSTDAGFTAIPGSGTPAIEARALHESDADPLPWGVAGTAGSTSREGSVEVQAFAEAGGRMYVGGNFRYVQPYDNAGARVEQSFLAAFDLQTGEWVQSFRPRLNEQVRALEVLPNGSIVAGGDFTSANGQPATGVVALDPTTGATDTGFRLTVENRVSGGMVRIWEFERLGDQLYLGGDFTHLVGGGRPSFTYMRALARVRATDGRTEPGVEPGDDGHRHRPRRLRRRVAGLRGRVLQHLEGRAGPQGRGGPHELRDQPRRLGPSPGRPPLVAGVVGQQGLPAGDRRGRRQRVVRRLGAQHLRVRPQHLPADQHDDPAREGRRAVVLGRGRRALRRLPRQQPVRLQRRDDLVRRRPGRRSVDGGAHAALARRLRRGDRRDPSRLRPALHHAVRRLGHARRLDGPAVGGRRHDRDPHVGAGRPLGRWVHPVLRAGLGRAQHAVELPRRQLEQRLDHPRLERRRWQRPPLPGAARRPSGRRDDRHADHPAGRRQRRGGAALLRPGRRPRRQRVGQHAGAHQRGAGQPAPRWPRSRCSTTASRSRSTPGRPATPRARSSATPGRSATATAAPGRSSSTRTPAPAAST
ncbi:fibrinogen-like YCDxxxxGGGW domain-containing protein [Nocardioides sp. TF02-7]|uniref:fibrinogen-like YCDxxxxGGGW domain-containing protein n=1 Tax=Nocardioides sp. TF02-7 TaxID=2917724 RepID=UPI001F0553A8|nr:fibrinogen-like YCDxxxxGGGW domain-containing protein [Nocardioides sp. TF02-7]UMG91349.1 hypothetical protein MF408_14410 [Nocardioides sp. TF02-7]